MPTEEEIIAREFLKDDEWWDAEYQGNMLDLEDEMVFPEYTLKFNGAPIAPVTGLQLLSGQSGHGKTQTATLLMSVYLGAQMESIELTWFPEERMPKVLYVDTEMEKGNTQLVVARISNLCGTSTAELKENLHVMRLREEESHEKIWKKILKAVYEIKPNVIFLDGLIDIVGDFNDNKESSQIIRKIMKVADHYNICMWAVMHQNPGSNKLVGHQGSIGERKSTMVLQTQKVVDDKERGLYHFEVENQKQRGQDVIPLKFRMQMFQLPSGRYNAYPCIDQPSQPIPPQAKNEPTNAEFVKNLSIPKDGMATRDFREAVKKAFSIGSTKADQKMWELEDEKYVTRGTNKRYYLGPSTEAENIFNGEQTEEEPF